MKRLMPVLLAAGMLMAGCSATVELKKHTFTIELGQDVYANPSLYIKDENMNTSSMSVVPLSAGIGKTDNRFVSKGYQYLLVGEYEFAIDNGISQTAFKIKIKDTQPPTVQKDVTQFNASLGENIDWNSWFQATDISGVSYDAPNDVTASAGEKDVTVKISDRLGNAIEKTVRVTVS